MHVPLRLQEPPEVINVGVGVHGTACLHDVFLLPDLWQLHLYSYSASLTLGGNVFPIRPGHVSLTPPGEYVRFDYRGRSEHLYAHFRLASRGPVAHVPVMQDAGLHRSSLSDMMLSGIAAFSQSHSHTVAEIWSVLWRVATLPTARERPNVVAEAMAYIEAHLARPLPVPRVARHVGLSHNHLTRLFRAETGDTVVAYIRRRRLNNAQHLLRHSTLSIPAIAASVGIPDLQAFNKACRRELGASPRALRLP